VSAKHAHAADVRLYDRLFKVADPGVAHDFLLDLNPESVKVVKAQLEPCLADAQPEQHFQFERHGYFIRDRDGGFNRTVTLRDSWNK
jgi:glutaminyl-tRNA synthetase